MVKMGVKPRNQVEAGIANVELALFRKGYKDYSKLAKHQCELSVCHRYSLPARLKRMMESRLFPSRESFRENLEGELFVRMHE